MYIGQQTSRYSEFSDWLNNLMKEEIMQTVIEVDGIRIQGTKSKVKETLSKLGYTFYESESKGLVLLSEIAPEHIRNAIIKKSISHFQKLRSEEPAAFTKRLVSGGLFMDDKELDLLANELKNRFEKTEDIGHPYMGDDFEEDDYYDTNDYGGDF